MRTLADVVAKLPELDEGLAIYAAPRWRAGSSAVVVAEPDDGSLPEQARGMTYLVTVAEARRAVAARRSWLVDPPPSNADQCAAVIYYAKYDAAEPLPAMPCSAAS